MARKRISISLLQKGRLDAGIKSIEQYEDELRQKCLEFCIALAKEGIDVANANNGTAFADAVMFGMQVPELHRYGCDAIMFGKNVKEVFGESVDHIEINPILFLEYGSGYFAAPPQSILDGHISVGRGTFPHPKNPNNAWNDSGWYWLSAETGRWVHSYGYCPHAPMQKAYEQMEKKVIEIARRVF